MFRGVNPPSTLSFDNESSPVTTERSWPLFSPKSWSSGKAWNETATREFSSSSTQQLNHRTGYFQSPPKVATHPLLVLLKHVFVLVFALIPVVCLVLVGILPIWNPHNGYAWSLWGGFNQCNVNGAFTPFTHPTFNLWNISGFFNINIFWGNFPFSTAKFIDIVWEIIVGRGGQALLAYITFKITTQALTRAMEKTPVSYNTFEALAFVPPSLQQTISLLRDMITNRGIQGRLIMLWIVFSSLFVLAFPSLVSAMSGYNTNTASYLVDTSGEYIPWTNLQIVQFTINDGNRLGSSGPIYVTDDYNCVFHGPDDDDDDKGPTASKLRRRDDDDNDDDRDEASAWAAVPTTCIQYWRTIQYVAQNGLNGKNKTASSFIFNGVSHNLTAPALNITTSYDPDSLSILTDYINPAAHEADSALWNVKSVSWATQWIYRNTTFDYDYVKNNGVCEPQNSHNWGFSFLILFLTTLLLSIWSVGSYLFWLHTYLNSSSQSSVRDMGILRASMDLVTAIHKDPLLGRMSEFDGDQALRRQVLIGRRRGRTTAGAGVSIDSQQRQPFSHTRWQEFQLWRAEHGMGALFRRRSRIKESSQRPLSTQREPEPYSSNIHEKNQSVPDTPVSTTQTYTFKNDLGDDV